MPKLGLGSKLTNSGLITPGVVTDNLVLKHNYNAGSVIPVSDGAAYFDGVDSYINCGDSSDWNFSNGSASKFSVSLWYKNSDASPDTYASIVAKNDTGADTREWRLSIDADDKLVCVLSDDGSGVFSNTSSFVVDDFQWHHVVMTYDGSVATANLRCQIYVDGVDVFTTGNNNNPAELYQGTASLTIGGHLNSGAATGQWTGYISEVAIYNSALTQPQIKSIMNKNYAGLTSSEKTNLVSWWNLDSSVTTVGRTFTEDSHGDNTGELL